MQRCENCNSRFGWRKILKSFWLTNKPIGCENCGTNHMITFFGRAMLTILTLIPMWAFINFLSPFNNIFVTIGIGFLVAIVGFLLTPFVVRYKKME